VEKYDFRFQVWTGTLLIIWVSLIAIGISAPTVENGKVTETGAPFWALFLAETLALPGLFFCMYAYWRAKRKAANLGIFFLCLAAYFCVALIGLRQNPDADNPSTSSFILAILTFAVVGAALIGFDHISIRRFTSEPALPGDRQAVSTGHPADSVAGKSAIWKFVTRIGRLLLFVVCLFLTRIVVSPKFIQQDWPRVAVFLVVLLLSCVISGLISEDAVPKFLSFLNLKLK
jgi:hypothetical protein